MERDAGTRQKVVQKQGRKTLGGIAVRLATVGHDSA